MSGPDVPDTNDSAIGIRGATDADLLSVTEILNAEIADSPYVWAEVPATIDDRRDWLETHRAANLPVLVATEPGDGARVHGWASLSMYRASSGYRFTVEASVYVARGAQRRGVGRRLLLALHDEARSRGLHAVVASIDEENAPSVALFTRFGYEEVARLPEVGRKVGTWRTQLLLLKTFPSMI